MDLAEDDGCTLGHGFDSQAILAECALSLSGDFLGRHRSGPCFARSVTSTGVGALAKSLPRPAILMIQGRRSPCEAVSIEPARTWQMISG